MRIGIDFDNTIACYDGVFHAAALARGLIEPDLARDKNSVRDHLNRTGRKDAFTELQGYVYGARMDLVAPYAGAREFIVSATEAGHQVFVVSHKTRRPLLGEPHDLHAAARGFLEARAIAGTRGPIPAVNAYFELTKEAKQARAKALGADVFIDDLPEILAMPGWPRTLRRILFDPEHHFVGAAGRPEGLERYASWPEIQHALLGC